MGKSNEVYERVRERDQHRCQYPVFIDKRGDTWRKCGQSFRTEAHHRRIRSQGGEDSEENLILLCPEHHTWCHMNPAEAAELGLIVRDGDDPGRHYWMDDKIPEDGYMDNEDAEFLESGGGFFDHDPGEFTWYSGSTDRPTLP